MVFVQFLKGVILSLVPSVPCTVEGGVKHKKTSLGDIINFFLRASLLPNIK